MQHEDRLMPSPCKNLFRLIVDVEGIYSALRARERNSLA